jgi:dienelactone hydrolase
MKCARALAAATMVALLGQTGTVQAQATTTGPCADSVQRAASRQLLEFRSQDRNVSALIYRPQTPNGAAVVLLHGGGGADNDAPRFDPHAMQLASRGYHVLVPSYFDAQAGARGGRGAQIRLWNRVATDAAREVGSMAGVQPTRIALWGYSLGGFLATDGAMDEGALARVAIGVSTGTDVWDTSRNRRSIPVLLLHGRRDPVISYSSMQNLANSLRDRGATVETVQIASNNHPLEAGAWCEVFDHTRRFLDTHLLPSPRSADIATSDAS